MQSDLASALQSLKSSKGWSWERMANEINGVQGGKKGVTGPTLFRYAKGTSNPRNELLKEYIHDAIMKLSSPISQEDLERLSPVSELGRAISVNNQIESFYQSLYQNTPIMMHSIGRDGRLLSVNQTWLETLGYEWHEVIGRKSVDFLTPSSRSVVEGQYMRQLRANGIVKNLELEFVKKSGEILNVRLSAKGLFDPKGDLEYRFAVMVDETEFAHSHRELEVLQSLLEKAPDHVLRLDHEGRIQYINKLLPGFTEESVIGHSIYEFVESEYVQAWREAIEHVIETGESRVVESKAYGSHRVPTWYEAHIGPLETNGQRTGVSIISSDISERKETEKRYRTLFESNIAGVFRTTVDGHLLDCNEAFALLLGYDSRDELFNVDVSEFYESAEDRDECVALLRKQGYVKNYEIRHRRKDGEVRWVLANSSLLEDETGERSIILGTLIDITEQKQLEERILKQNEYLQVLHDTALGIISHTELNVLLEAIMLRAGSLVGTSHGFIYLSEPGTMQMSVKFATGELRRFIGAKTNMGEGLAGRVWQTGRPIAVDNYRDWAERLDVSEYDILHSIVGLPLKSGRDVIGVIGLAHLDPEREFGDEEISTLSQFAELASIALDNVRLYEQFQRELSQRDSDLKRLQNSMANAIADLRVTVGKIVDKKSDANEIESLAHRMSEELEEIATSIRDAVSGH